MLQSVDQIPINFSHKCVFKYGETPWGGPAAVSHVWQQPYGPQSGPQWRANTPLQTGHLLSSCVLSHSTIQVPWKQWLHSNCTICSLSMKSKRQTVQGFLCDSECPVYSTTVGTMSRVTSIALLIQSRLTNWGNILGGGSGELLEGSMSRIGEKRGL